MNYVRSLEKKFSFEKNSSIHEVTQDLVMK